MNDYNKNIYDSTDAEIDDGSMITDVKSNGKDFTVGNIINLWNDGELKIPEFQRRYVWKIEQASKFIESLMLGLPIPSLMVYEDKDSYLLVIDGQQRIKSILLFVGAINTDTASKHSKHETSLCNFKLKGLADDSIYKNKSYNDFTEKEKRIFKNKCSLYINLISLTNPDNLTSVYHIFERLNTGGTLLTAQEIRNCIFAGPFNDFIIRLNDYSNWKKFITNKSSESHQQDVELVLRFFALYDMKIPYKRPMKDYLTKYMKLVRYMSDEEMAQKELLFNKTVDAIYNTLGETPFHIKNGLNSAVLDSVMIAFSRNLNRIPDDIAKKYKELYKNNEFYSYCSKSVNDVISVKSRIQMADEYLFEKVYDINLKVIKLYELPASAGVGNFINDENIPYTKIYTAERRADFAIKISGDSMEPDIFDGDIVLVKKQEKINSGQIGIFIYDSELLCKKFYKNKKQISLISLNKEYPPKDVSSNRIIDTIVLVLGKHQPT